MISGPPDFISRFLYQIRDDEFYGNPGLPPKPETIKQAAAAAKNVLGFDAHRAWFTLLAEADHICSAEELQLRGSGIAARNASTASTNCCSQEIKCRRRRAGLSAGRSPGWHGWRIAEWIQNATLRDQIAKQVMTAIWFCWRYQERLHHRTTHGRNRSERPYRIATFSSCAPQSGARDRC